MSEDSGHAVNTTDSGVLKPLLVLAVPIMLANLLQIGYNLTDTYWVGRLGQSAVTALGFSWAIVFLVVSVAGGFNVAGSVLVAQHKGADKHTEVDRVAGQTIAVIGGLSILFAVGGYLFAPMLLRFVGAVPTTESYRLAVSYTRIGFLGTPFVFGLYVYQGLLKGWGDTRTPLYIVGGSVVVNVVIDPFFILGFRNNPLFGVFGRGVEQTLYATTGFGGLGIEGAAIATVLSRGLGAIVAFGALLTGRVGITPTLRDLWPRRAVVKKLFRVGVPASIEQTIRAAGVAVLTAIVAIAGQEAVAAYSIGNRLLGLIYLPAVGLSSGMETMVGQNLGAGQRDRVDRVVTIAAVSLTGLFAVVTTVTIVFAEPIVGVFITGEGATAVVNHGMTYLRVVGVTFTFFGVFRIIQGAFRGGGATKVAMGFSVAALFLFRVPPAYVLLTWFKMGASGVWYGIAASNVAVCLLVVLWFRRRTWTNRLVDNTEGTPEP